MSDLNLYLQDVQTETTVAALEAFFAETFAAKPCRKSPQTRVSSEQEKADLAVAVRGLTPFYSRRVCAPEYP
jgi:hypothetical protein